MAVAENGIFERYLTITIERKSFEEAKAQFATLEATIHKAFIELGAEIVPLSGDERIKVLYDYYHLGDENSFNFSLKEAKKVGADFKNDLCNGMIKFFPDHFEDESKFCKALFTKKYPSSLSERFINEITSLPVHSITSIDVVPVPKDLTTKTLQKKYLGIESDIIKQQRVRNKNNDFSTEISYAKRTEKREIESIMDDVRENDQCLFYVGVTIIVMAESKKELDSICETIETIGKRNSCTIDTHFLKQREALNTALPIGIRHVETMRTMLTQSLAVLMPFNVQELNDSGGNYYGINKISKNINVGNRKKLINGNGFVFGVSGSGKSFFCKMEMGSVFLYGDDEIIVIDPMNEYFDIAETYGGTVVNKSSNNYPALQQSISGIYKIANKLFAGSLLFAGVTVSLLLFLWMNARKKEIAILLSLGITKAKIFGQFVIELVFVSIPAFIGSYFLAVYTSSMIGNNILSKVTGTIAKQIAKQGESSQLGGGAEVDGFNKTLTSLEINISPKLMIYVILFMTIVLMISLLISLSSNLRKSPKELLIDTK